MNADRWKQVSRLYGAALAKQGPERGPYLDQACANDPDLRLEVEALLAESREGETPLDRPVAALAGEVLGDTMVGRQLGPYQLDSLIGAGGMGQVYRATDTRLHRTVAVKVLLLALAADAQFRARFEREAKAIAALNHPHICTLHDVGHHDGVSYLVMELVDGVSLATRLERGALPFDEALRDATEIADALAAAHRQGIVHRDLKPGNVMITKTGVKLLDFGLAKTGAGTAGKRGGPLGPLSMLPTTPPNAPPLTVHGTILGTFQYMAPEQLEGQEADARTDIFAFGALVYELFTGQKAFEGKSQASLIGAIMHADPAPMSARQPVTPPALERLVRTCLAKDPDDRWQSIRDVARELGQVARDFGRIDVVARVPRRARLLGVMLAAAVVAGGIIAVPLWRASQPATVVPPPIVVDLNAPATSRPESIAIAPNGRTIAFVGESAGRDQLWVRSLDSDRPHLLAGTEDATYPFWSADGRSIAFEAGGKIQRVDLDTGAVHTIVSGVNRVFGGSWSRNDTILFVTGGGPVVSVSASGGPTRIVVAPESLNASGGFRTPAFLPDGQHFVFFVVSSGGGTKSAVFVGDLNGTPPRRLLEASSGVVYAAGHLLFVRGGRLYKQRFDPVRLVLSGEPSIAVDGTIYIGSGNVAALTASDGGDIVYRLDDHQMRRQFTWVDRAGTIVKRVGEVDVANALNPSLSPDGHHVVYSRRVDNNTDLWVLDLDRGTTDRLTRDPGIDQYPIWSRDGSSVIFSSIRDEGFHLYQKGTTAAATESLLLSKPPRAKVATDWSSQDFVSFQSLEFDSGYDIFALPMSGDRVPIPVVQSPGDDRDAQFSPDGKWIAYSSDESGRNEVYIQAFPKAGRRFGPISKGGGAQPRWRADGKELFYLSRDGYLMSVLIRLDEQTVEAQTPTPLFAAHVLRQPPLRPQYAVSPQGDRFLLNMLLDDEAGLPMTMILNGLAAPRP